MRRTIYNSCAEYRFAWLFQILRTIELLIWFFTLGKYTTDLCPRALCYDTVTEWFKAEILRQEVL